MIKNRTAQLIWQSFYLGIALIGVLASLGLFDMAYRWDFYIYFTNLSNYFCIAIMVLQLIRTIKRTEDGPVPINPVLKLASVVAIVVTFFVFNFMIATEEGRDPIRNFSAMSIILHIILPVMYVADWILFHERRTLKWKDPMAALFFPGAYIVYVVAHAAIRRFDGSILGFIGQNPLIYPYFFLNPLKYGIIGVMQWCVLLAIAFAALGYVFVAVDRMLSLIKKYKCNRGFADDE